MNQQRRYDLRMKHQDWSGHCPVCHTETACDVINVLDAWEASLFECDHVEGGEIPHTTEGINVWLHFTYCPECGEKL